MRADLKRPWDAVSRAAGLDGVRIHDLRHTHAATGAGAGLGLQMVGKLLGHSQPQTTQRYAHLDADPMKRASNVIGDTISAAMDGKKPAGKRPKSLSREELEKLDKAELIALALSQRQNQSVA